MLALANLTLDSIDAIELLGGGVRVPKIQEILKQYVGERDIIGQHLNGDEAMALGASFLAANFSPSFRVRDLRLNDGFNFEVRLLIKNIRPTDPTDEKFINKTVTLFRYKQRFGSKKNIVFKHMPTNLMLEVYAVYMNATTAAAEPELLAIYRMHAIENIKKDPLFARGECPRPKYHLQFSINSVDIVQFDKMSLEFNYTELVLHEVSDKEDELFLKFKKTQEEERLNAQRQNATSNDTNDTSPKDSNSTDDETTSQNDTPTISPEAGQA